MGTFTSILTEYRRWKISLGVLFTFMAAAFFAYRRALHGDFFFDDNLRIADFSVLDGKIVFVPQPAYAEGLGPLLAKILPDRPLLMLTIWLNYAADGIRPYWFKATNVFLHAGTAWIFFHFVRSAQTFLGMKKTLWLPFAAGLVFLLHPLNSQAVTMVIQRGVLMSSAFGMLSLICAFAFLSGRGWLFSQAAGFFLLLGLLCKSNTFSVPLIICLFAFIAGKTKDLKEVLIPMLLACVFPVVFYLWFQDNFHPQSTSATNWLNYGLVQSQVVFHYLKQVFWPFEFNISYPIPINVSFGEVWPYCLGHLGIFVLAVIQAKERPMVTAGIAAFYLSLIPESSFFPIPHVVFDHRMYFPLIFFLLAVQAALLHAASLLKFTIIPLAIFLGVQTDLRCRETSSYMGWLNTAATRNMEDTLTSVNLLNLLFLTGAKEELREKSAAFARRFPANREYKLFADLSLQQDASDFQLRVITDPSYDFLSDITRVNFLQKLYLDFTRDTNPVRAMLKIHALLGTQESHFHKASFDQLREVYESNRLRLLPHFAEIARQGLLNAFQRELWLTAAPASAASVKEMPMLVSYFYWQRTKGFM